MQEAILRVRMFGAPSFECDKVVADGPHPRKALELFCYLLLQRDRPLHREALASLFWQESTTAQSRKYLRQTLWQLRASLKPCVGDGVDDLLRVESNWVLLRSTPRLWLDVAEVERAHARTQDIPGPLLAPDAVLLLQEAVDLCAGDLLAGWYQDWCLHERERLGAICLTLLDKLMDSCEARHEYERGLEYGERALLRDRASERTHLKMMRLHYLAGNRAGALRQYERCAAALAEELDAVPGRLTSDLYDRIMADDTAAVTAPTPPVLPLPGTLDYLRQIQAALSDIQSQIQHEIQSASENTGY